MANLKPATRTVAICIGIIALAAVICFGLSRHYQIEHPVICKVYGAYTVYTDEGDEISEVFRIPYVTCAAGEQRIADIRFDGAAWLSVLEEDEAGEEDENVSHVDNTFYTRKELTIAADIGDTKLLKLNKPLTLTSAVVTYEDDTKEKIDLGKIILYPQKVEDGPLEDGGEVYDDAETGMRCQNLLVTKAMRIKSVEPTPQDEKVKICINGKPFEEVKDKLWKKDQETNFSLDIKRDYFLPYEPVLKVSSVTEDGKEHVQYLGSFKQELWHGISFSENACYLKERGVIQ